MMIPETILERLHEVFRSEGIERNSEEELMQQLRISEGEYRQLFANRADMVQKVVLHDLSLQEARDDERIRYAKNPVEKIILLLQHGIQDLKMVNPAFIIDLQLHYPQVWEMVLQHLESYNHDLDLRIVNEGVVQGYFRKDINLQLVAKIIIEQFNMVINPNIFPPERYNLGEVFRSVYLYYVRGLCTDKGAKLAEEYFAKNNI
ncbi:TetR/AcrR family transcriptional regulator C-terminal domain-containing protein [Pontibacter mangrovi]|uniref:TetR/AcrR family transcriptional regulator n=1 Tax=Pontibacter mangrovi TaxID=2589816 RepID=A0A501W6H5_9BACT|nr:TetR/AcrR family transcriptional regulator C-terminal domain-containing protein [Pontibacter mangrovi]TPE45503.1 TetR/AcrR family transcriptional regulator [Pontibacter mangrovi]